MKSGLFSAALILLLWSSAQAQQNLSISGRTNAGSRPPQCLQGSPENTEFIQNLRNAQRGDATLPAGFKKFRDGIEVNERGYWEKIGTNPLPFLEDTHASHQNCELNHNSTSDYAKILHAIAVPQVKLKCIEAAVKRHVPGQNHYCDDDMMIKAKTYTNNTTGQCISSEVVQYYQWAIQQAYSCLAYESAGPLDMKLIFKIFNNESGFSVFQKGKGGMGIGQLTTDAVADMAEEKVPGVFDRIEKSTRKECLPFKTALFSNKPDKITPGEPMCRFQGPGHAFARQLIYSMGYLLRIRDGLMNIPKKLAAKGIEDIRFANLILAVRYSAEARKAPALLQHLLDNPKQSFAKFNEYVENNTKYADDMNKTFKDMQEIDPSIKSAADCIEY